MEQTKHIHISEYNYPLPDERIAKYPLKERDQSKLLVYRRGVISDDRFTSLPDYLPEGSLVVFNNTKVIQARLHFRKETGALIEVFCLEPTSPADYAQNFQQTKSCAWLVPLHSPRVAFRVRGFPLTSSVRVSVPSFHFFRLPTRQSHAQDFVCWKFWA